MSSSTSTLAKVWAVPPAVASTAAVDVVGLGLDEPAGYEPHRRVVLLTALVALCSVFPATLDRVVVAAVAVELEDEYSDLFSLRDQRSFLAALATFAECVSPQPSAAFLAAVFCFAHELTKRTPPPRHYSFSARVYESALATMTKYYICNDRVSPWDCPCLCPL